MSERLEAEAESLPRMSSTVGLLREAAELARRVEGAPIVQVPGAVMGGTVSMAVPLPAGTLVALVPVGVGR